MLNFKKAFEELQQGKDDFISLYDLIVLIRSHYPTLSDNNIATVLIDQFKTFHQKLDSAYYNRSIFNYQMLDEERRELLALEDNDIFLYTMPKKLHEPPFIDDFETLITYLEHVEDNGITPDPIPF